MKKRRGFTFIELILAIFLFSFGIISVLQVFPINRRFLTQSSMQTQASFLAAEQMENMRSVAYADLTVGAYEPNATLPGTIGAFAAAFQRTTVVSLINGTYASTGTDIGLKKIVVTVSWSENNATRTYVLTSYANNL